MKKFEKVLALVLAASMVFGLTTSAATIKTAKKTDYYKKASTSKKVGKLKSGTKLNALSYSKGYVKFKTTKGTFYIKLSQVKFSGKSAGVVSKSAYSYKANLKTKSKKFTAGTNVVISKLVAKGNKQYFLVNESYYLDCMNVKINSFATPVATPAPTPTIIPGPTDSPIPNTETTPCVQYIGRYVLITPAPSSAADVKAYVKYDFPGTTVRAKFSGTTSVSAIMATTSTNTWIDVIVDGITLSPINLKSGKNTYVLAKDLTTGEHEINVVKRTEAGQGQIDFYNFDFGSGTLLTPNARPQRFIQFFGDSITCGFGSEGTIPDAQMAPERENYDKTYAALTAKALGADQQAMAVSGWGVTQAKNSGGTSDGRSGGKIQSLFERSVASTSVYKWDPTLYRPQVSVINLHTNDMGGSPAVSKDDFLNGYKELYTKIRTAYPNTVIYCCVGPLVGGDGLINSRAYIKEFVAARNKEGDNRVLYFEFAQQDVNVDKAGDMWHPSAATHKKMADKLIKDIREKMGWYN